jgi:hypothetical protein
MDVNELIELATAAESASGPDRIQELRQNLAQSPDADPREIEQAADAAFHEAYNGGSFAIDEMPRLEALADIVEAARELATERERAQARIRDRAAALAEAKSKPTDDEEEDGEDKADAPAGKPADREQGAEGTEGGERGRGGGEGSGGRSERRGEVRDTEDADAGAEGQGGSRDEERGGRDGNTGEDGDAGGRKRGADGRFLPDDGDEEADGSEELKSKDSKGNSTDDKTGKDDVDDNGGGAPSSRRRVSLSAEELNAQRDQKLVAKAPNRSFTITASADTPDVQMGANMSIKDLAAAARTRMQSLPVGQQVEGEMRRSIAQVNRIVDERFVVDGANPVVDAEKIDWIADEKRLPGGSLVAAAKQEYENLQASAGGMQTFPTPPGDIWCSPSETDYSLCPPLATRTGLIDLPSFQVRRGGIRYPVWKQYPEQHRPLEHGPGDKEVSNDQAQGWYKTHTPPEDYPYDAQYVSDGPRHDWHGYVHTNRNTIGAKPALEDPDYFIKNPKKHIQGPCVEWAEERMHMAYLWIEEDILRNHTYPELAERFMEDALLSHAHYMNETYIRWIVSHSDRLDPFWAGSPGWGGPGDPPRNGVVPPGPMSHPLPVATNNYYPGSYLDYGSYGLFGMGSAAEAVLERIGWLVSWFRNTYRMGRDTTLEGIAPYWFRDFLKLDIERKLNRPHNFRVTDAEVDALFAMNNCRINWVYDWQDLPSTEYNPPYDDVMSSHIMPRGGWPNAVDIVLYPSGSWVLAEQNIIRLEATYDSNRLRNNKFTSLYMEDAWMLLNRCNRSFVVQLRGLCANGATGEPWQPCSPEEMPTRRELIEAGCTANMKQMPPQAIDGGAASGSAPDAPQKPAPPEKPPAKPEDQNKPPENGSTKPAGGGSSAKPKK